MNVRPLSSNFDLLPFFLNGALVTKHWKVLSIVISGLKLAETEVLVTAHQVGLSAGAGPLGYNKSPTTNRYEKESRVKNIYPVCFRTPDVE